MADVILKLFLHIFPFNFILWDRSDYPHFLGQYSLSESVSCSVVSDSLRPMDCGPPGSSVHEILQAKVLEYWRELPFSSLRNLSDPRIEPGSLSSQADSLPSEPAEKPVCCSLKKSSDLPKITELINGRTRVHTQFFSPQVRSNSRNCLLSFLTFTFYFC